MQIHELRDENGNVIHACATASFPLPTNHWIYAERVRPQAISDTESELSNELRVKVREALKYTIQACTSGGKDEDFDPDAMLMTLEHTLFTENAIKEKNMTPEQHNIVAQLDDIKTILEDLVSEADVKLKGYAAGAIDVAVEAVSHAIDLVRISEEIRKSG